MKIRPSLVRLGRSYWRKACKSWRKSPPKLSIWREIFEGSSGLALVAPPVWRVCFHDVSLTKHHSVCTRSWERYPWPTGMPALLLFTDFSSKTRNTAIHPPPMKRFQKNCCGLRCWPLGNWVEWGSGFRASRSPLFRKSTFVVGQACRRWRLFGDTSTPFFRQHVRSLAFSLAFTKLKNKKNAALRLILCPSQCLQSSAFFLYFG